MISSSSSLAFGIDDQAFAVGVGFQPIMRDDGAFLGKALGVLLFFFEKRFRHEKREVRVLTCPVALNISSSARCIFSQIA